jgi:hypothetical protein
VTISVETELRSRASPSRSTICSAEHTCTESYGCVCVYIAFGSADLDLRLRCSDFQTTAHALVWAFTSYVPTCGNEGVNTTLVEPAMLISVVRSTFPGPLKLLCDQVQNRVMGLLILSQDSSRIPEVGH